MSKIEFVLPSDIERRSFEIIESELTVELDEEIKPIVKRVIHTTADFSYAENMVFSKDAVKNGILALEKGTTVITDTNMVKSGINKKALKKFNGNVECFMADEDIERAAKEKGITRAAASMEKAAELYKDGIYVIGNAPTALIVLRELILKEAIKPSLIIGVPVGFVNVVESKEMIMECDVPFIVAKGRRGGSNVAAAIVNALLYKGGC